MKKFRAAASIAGCTIMLGLSRGVPAAENWESVGQDAVAAGYYDSANVTHEGDLTFVVMKSEYKQPRAKLGEDGKDISYKVGLTKVALDCRTAEVWEYSKGFQDLNSGIEVWDKDQFLIDRWPRYARPVYGQLLPELLNKVCK
jgi:hypothetical protein